MPQINFIPEKDAAAMLGYVKDPRTFRKKVMGTGAYKGRQPLPIAFTGAGKGYRYCQQDIEKFLLKTSSK